MSESSHFRVTVDTSLSLRCLRSTSSNHFVRFSSYPFTANIHYDSTAPEDELRQQVEYYFHLGMSDPQILSNVREHFDMAMYGVRYDSETF